MTLVKWKNNHGLGQWEREVKDLFDALNFSLIRPETAGISEWSPRVEFKENSERYQISAELPGVEKEDVKIEFDKGLLTIKGEKKEEKKEEKNGYFRSERNYGSFSRSFRIPGAVKEDSIKAEYKNGILNLFLPKAEEIKPKTIKIN